MVTYQTSTNMIESYPVRYQKQLDTNSWKNFLAVVDPCWQLMVFSSFSSYLYLMNDMKSTGRAQTLLRNTFSQAGVYPAYVSALRLCVQHLEDFAIHYCQTLRYW